MARNIQNRLDQLKKRRTGTDRLSRLGYDSQVELLVKSSKLEESWEKRAQKPYTRYALGSMQEVGSDYTRISLETADRVGKQLATRLTAAGFSIEFRLQGSVPLNTHIRGVSDVDLLNIDLSFYTYATGGVRSVSGGYQNPTSRTSLQVLSELRSRSEKELTAAFPAAHVDTTGGKAINISGGSLARPVDVIPSHWHDNAQYQSSSNETDRGVTILNKKVPETIANLPFKHIAQINLQDALAFGGLKKAIRLCKNVKNDAGEEGRSIELSSYDIAAIMYHAKLSGLRAGLTHELAILAETQRHLDWLYHHPQEADKLVVPDGSRSIFDTPVRRSALLALSSELDDLLKEVAKEQANFTTDPTFQLARDALANVNIPSA
jgi:hypothetical protein